MAREKRTGEGWEYLRAFGRLVLSLPPWHRWKTASAWAIAITGAVAVPVIGLITHHVLLTAVVVLGVFVYCSGMPERGSSGNCTAITASSWLPGLRAS